MPLKGTNRPTCSPRFRRGSSRRSPTPALWCQTAVTAKPLKGIRVGIVREFMVKHTKNDEAISDQIDQEIKTVLRDKLGAELVESVDPLYPDDPEYPT